MFKGLCIWVVDIKPVLPNTLLLVNIKSVLLYDINRIINQTNAMINNGVKMKKVKNISINVITTKNIGKYKEPGCILERFITTSSSIILILYMSNKSENESEKLFEKLSMESLNLLKDLFILSAVEDLVLDLESSILVPQLSQKIAPSSNSLPQFLQYLAI